ncbi:MAG TPA: hypothetical protein VMW50_02355 [Dehalococcoidia bacterium]|nr:hypothetical protein [Dehalococcoidia bacterium]
MKAETTIRHHIVRLRRLAQNRRTPRDTANGAYEAWHALRWVIEDVSWTPASLLEDEAAEAAEEKR